MSGYTLKQIDEMASIHDGLVKLAAAELGADADPELRGRLQLGLDPARRPYRLDHGVRALGQPRAGEPPRPHLLPGELHAASRRMPARASTPNTAPIPASHAVSTPTVRHGLAS